MTHKHVFSKFAGCDICGATLEEIENMRKLTKELQDFSRIDTIGKSRIDD